MGNKYARLFAIIKEANSFGAALTKEQVVSDFTNERTKSLSDLSDAELTELIDKLAQLHKKPAEVDHGPLDASRKAIIAQFKAIGKTADDAKAWAEKYGVFGNKKKFNEYNGQELHQLIKNAEKVRADTINAVNKKII